MGLFRPSSTTLMCGVGHCAIILRLVWNAMNLINDEANVCASFCIVDVSHLHFRVTQSGWLLHRSERKSCAVRSTGLWKWKVVQYIYIYIYTVIPTYSNFIFLLAWVGYPWLSGLSVQVDTLSFIHSFGNSSSSLVDTRWTRWKYLWALACRL